MKHVLCAHLRHWPIDRLRRRRPGLRREPLVLVETTGTRQTVVHVSPEIQTTIWPGMALAEARARHAGLIDLPATPAADAHALEALGHWLMRFSPSVCVYPPCSVFLDATGLERLFGGLHHVQRMVAEALAALRITASVKIAPTPGAAWALAAFDHSPSPGTPGKGWGEGDLERRTTLEKQDHPHPSPLPVYRERGQDVVTRDGLIDALSPLPPEALRLDPAAAEMLRALGVRSIGMLLQLSRAELAVRFGAHILLQIDQATGAAPEPLTFLIPRSSIRASLEFEGGIESLEAIHFAVQALTRQVVEQLAVRGLGARELRLTFRPPYAPAIEKVVRLVRPSRNESALLKLLCCALETLSSSDGFVAAGLTVTSTERLGDEQAALIGGEAERDAAELDHLVERLRARLDRAVEWGELVESNLPEHACRCGTLQPITPGSEVLRRPGSLGAPEESGSSRVRSDPGVGVIDVSSPRVVVDALRPLRLLAQPRPVQAIVRPSESREGEPISFTDDRGDVHRLAHVRGPERITGQWWNGRWKVRDYFDVLDAGGGRYWIFRVAQTGRWFLHGIFE